MSRRFRDMLVPGQNSQTASSHSADGKRNVYTWETAGAPWLPLAAEVAIGWFVHFSHAFLYCSNSLGETVFT